MAYERAIPVVVVRNKQDNQQALQKLKTIGGEAFAVEAELSNPEASENAVKAVIAKYERIDVIANNAGINDGDGLKSVSYEKFMQSLHSNLVHHYLMVHFALPELRKSKGAIVNISSKTAETGQGNTSAYAASNGGQILHVDGGYMHLDRAFANA